MDWQTLVSGRQGTPPIEPSGAWSPRWQAAVGVALAHLLAASAGTPVAVPSGPVADTFGRALDAVLPPGPPRKEAALAGPGLTGCDPATDVALVPQHPRTGKAWQPFNSFDIVPLAADVWMYLAFPHERPLIPASGAVPDGVLRDDPLPLHPWGLFRPDWQLFLDTLARLPPSNSHGYAGSTTA